ncbi:tail fiber domain-containing protein [Dokdonella ginsengisoli]
MKTRTIPAALALALALGATAAHAASFTYHGSLDDGGQPASGRYDLRLTPYASENAAAPRAEAITLYGVEVKDGRFSTEVDFGSVAADGGWIGVAVRKAGDGEFAELGGRSEINGSGECWSTTGNTGLPGGSFIGTLDNQNLIMRVGDRFGAGIRHYTDGVSFEVGNSGASAAHAAAFNHGLAYAVDSFAAGRSSRVPAGHDRTFVWGGRDFTGDANRVESTGPDQFVVYADGGFIINGSTVPFAADDLVIYPRGGGDLDADLQLRTPSGHYGKLYVRNSDGVMQVLATGGVHINTPVRIADSLKVEGPASKSTAGAWQANSDGRIKQDIAPVEDALDTLAKVHPVSFRYTDAYRAEHPQVADQRYYNVIAQQFAEVFPDAVTKSGEYLPGAEKTADNEILQVDTYPAQIVTIAAVQELAQKNRDLAQKNAALETAMTRLMARVAKLEAGRGK